MKYVKMLGLLAVAAAALMAFAGTASATVTSPEGVVYNGALVATSTNSELTGSVKVACTHSIVEGTVTSGATEGPVTSLTFSGCGKDTVTALGTGHSAGTLKINSNGSVTSTGAEVTVQLHRSVLGFAITTHCIYVTNNTSIGSLTEGVKPAVLHIGSSPIDRKTTDSGCGEESIWNGDYNVITPSSEIVVD